MSTVTSSSKKKLARFSNIILSLKYFVHVIFPKSCKIGRLYVQTTTVTSKGKSGSPRNVAESAVAYSTRVNIAMLFLLAHSALNDHRRLFVFNIHDQM